MTASKANTLVWFRNDLRVQDNQTLVAACEHATAERRLVRAVFISTPQQWQQHDVAPIQLDFIERQLNQLASELAALGIPLDICHLDTFSDIPVFLTQYVGQWQVDRVFASSEPEFNECQRDIAVAAEVNLTLYQQHCLLAPLSVRNLSGEMYKVFTPFAKKWREIARANRIQTVDAPNPIAAPLIVAKKLSCNVKK